MDTLPSLNITCVDSDGKQVPLQTFSGGLGATFTFTPVVDGTYTFPVVTQPSAQLEFPFVQTLAH